MDGDFFRSVSFGPISEVLEMIDPEIGLVLEQLGERSREDIAAELIRAYELRMLMEARDSIFRSALDKVDWCLSHVAKARALATFVPSMKEEKLISNANKLFKRLSPKDMITRKGAKNAVHDIIDLLRFIGGNGTVFRVSVMKTKRNGTTRNSLGGMSPDDLKCLQHISEIMPYHISEDEHDDDIVIIDGGECTKEMEVGCNGLDTKMGIAHESNRVSNHDVHDHGPPYERVPSLMFGHGTRELEIQGDKIRDIMTRKVNVHENGMVDVGICEGGSIFDERHDVRSSDLNAPHAMPQVDQKDVTRSRTFSDINLVNAAEITLKEMAPNANESTVRATDHIATSNEDGSLPRCERCVSNDFACQQGPQGSNTPVPASHSPLGTSQQYPDRPRNTLPTPANISVQFGGRTVNIDITSLFNMASLYPIDARERDDRRGEPNRQVNECDGCDRRIDAQARRVDAVEDGLSEEVRKLKVENREMAQDLRDVKKKLRDMSSACPAMTTTRRSDIDTDGYASMGVATSSDHAGATKNIMRASDSKGDRQLPRQRAATFAGQESRGGARPKQRQRGNNDMQQAEGLEHPPKPQRVGERRTRAQQNRRNGDDRDIAPRDNPIRNWLTAKKGEAAAESTPEAKQTRRMAVRSPSWADDDSDDDDETSMSGVSAPTPTPHHEDLPIHQPESPDGGTTSKPDADDVYLLPPSGQVTEANIRQGRTSSAGGAAKLEQQGAPPKFRGKSGAINMNAQRVNRAVKPTASKSAPGKSGRGTSYVKVVTKNGWTTVPKKRKFDNVSPRAAFPLKGIPATVNRHIYLQGLDMSDGQGADDIADSIRAYLRERGVVAVYVRIIPVKCDSTRTGCKLMIKEEDYERVISDEFWPYDVTVRDWTPRPRNDDDDDNL